jgi:hypothetical protein
MEDELMLQVIDTGIGMREEDLHRARAVREVENELTRCHEGPALASPCRSS